MQEFISSYGLYIVNALILGIGYWAGSRGPAKVWQDLTGDIADIRTKISALHLVATAQPAPKS